MPKSNLILGIEKHKRITTLLLVMLLSLSLLYLSGCGANSKQNEAQFGSGRRI